MNIHLVFHIVRQCLKCCSPVEIMETILVCCALCILAHGKYLFVKLNLEGLVKLLFVFSLLCLIVRGSHIKLFEIFHPSSNLIRTPYFSRMCASSPSPKFSLSFLSCYS